MDLSRIVSELKHERARLDAAIAALEGFRPGRAGAAAGRDATTNGRRRRHMSAAARRRISQAMKQRWAERKRKSA